MSLTITVEEAQASLKELIGSLKSGEEIVITDNHQRVAKIVGERSALKQRPGPGLCKGIISIAANDDEHLKDFAEYMP